MKRNEIGRWFAKPQSFMRSIVCGCAAQVLVDEMQVHRSEEAVVGESPKCLHQSDSEAEDTVQRIESLTQTCARVLGEKLDGKVGSKSIASSRPDRQVVLSQPEKRDGGHGTRSRVKGKEYDGPLTQVCESMRSRAMCCEVAEPESRELAWIARTRRARTPWAQQLEVSSFSRSGGQ